MFKATSIPFPSPQVFHFMVFFVIHIIDELREWPPTKVLDPIRDIVGSMKTVNEGNALYETGMDFKHRRGEIENLMVSYQLSKKECSCASYFSKNYPELWGCWARILGIICSWVKCLLSRCSDVKSDWSEKRSLGRLGYMQEDKNFGGKKYYKEEEKFTQPTASCESEPQGILRDRNMSRDLPWSSRLS